MVFKEQFQVPIEIQIELTRDRSLVRISSFCRSSRNLLHFTLTEQKIVPTLKPISFLPYSRQTERPFFSKLFSIFFPHRLKLLSKTELNLSFSQTNKTEERIIVLQKVLNVNSNSFRKLELSKTSPCKVREEEKK